MANQISRIITKIALGSSVSGAVSLNGRIPWVLDMSALWTAADLSFAGSQDDFNWYYIYKSDGGLLTLPTGVSRRIILPYQYLTDHRSLKICSGTHDAPVVQAAERSLYIELWEA